MVSVMVVVSYSELAMGWPHLGQVTQSLIFMVHTP